MASESGHLEEEGRTKKKEGSKKGEVNNENDAKEKKKKETEGKQQPMLPVILTITK